MTDAELAKFLGMEGHPKVQKFIDGLTPAKRAVFERMKQVEIEVELYAAGLGPKPEGVLLDLASDVRCRRAWR